MPSTRPNNLTAVPAARLSLGAWTALCPLRGLHDLIRIAGCQECWRESALARLSSGGDDVMKVFGPPSSSSHQHLASRKPPSEAACQVCLNLHSWVILPSKASLRQDVFRVKIFTVNAIGEQSSHACRDMQRNALPASAAAALVSEVSPTWLSHGPSRNSRALSELHSLPPSTHRMCFLLIRQREHASF